MGEFSRYIFKSLKTTLFSPTSVSTHNNAPTPESEPDTYGGSGNLFPIVTKEIDGEDCSHDCKSCMVTYPKNFKIDEEDQIYGHVQGWSTHMLVATGKIDWLRNIGDEEGSVMEAIQKNAEIKPSSGTLMLLACNIPIPSRSLDYESPTTVLLLPAWIFVENVTPKSVNTLISDFVDKGPTTSTPLGQMSVPRSLPDKASTDQLCSRPCSHNALILLCSQGTRDARCGQSAPLLREEFERHLRDYGLNRNLDDERPGGVGIYFISHVGGHKYSANVLVYRKKNAFGIHGWESHGNISRSDLSRPKLRDDDVLDSASQCIWLARVKPEDCKGIIKYTVLQGKIVKPDSQLRGGFDRERSLLSW